MTCKNRNVNREPQPRRADTTYKRAVHSTSVDHLGNELDHFHGRHVYGRLRQRRLELLLRDEYAPQPIGAHLGRRRAELAAYHGELQVRVGLVELGARLGRQEQQAGRVELLVVSHEDGLLLALGLEGVGVLVKRVTIDGEADLLATRLHLLHRHAVRRVVLLRRLQVVAPQRHELERVATVLVDLHTQRDADRREELRPAVRRYNLAAGGHHPGEAEDGYPELDVLHDRVLSAHLAGLRALDELETELAAVVLAQRLGAVADARHVPAVDDPRVEQQRAAPGRPERHRDGHVRHWHAEARREALLARLHSRPDAVDVFRVVLELGDVELQLRRLAEEVRVFWRHLELLGHLELPRPLVRDRACGHDGVRRESGQGWSSDKQRRRKRLQKRSAVQAVLRRRRHEH